MTVEFLEGPTVPRFLGVLDFPVRGGPSVVAAGDVNNDGWVDLVAPAKAGIVSVLLGNGDLTFQAQRDSVAGGAGGLVSSITLGDFNGDGRLEATTLNAADTVCVQIGIGDATFRATKSTAVGPDLRSVTAADLNGDGKLDLAVTSVGADQKNLGTTVAILMGRGDGTFNPPTRLSVGNGPIFVTTGDFNGDDSRSRPGTGKFEQAFYQADALGAGLRSASPGSTQ